MSDLENFSPYTIGVLLRFLENAVEKIIVRPTDTKDTHTGTHNHTHTHTHIHTQIHIPGHTRTQARTHKHSDTHTHTLIQYYFLMQ